jgi:hypothetical protein
MDLRLWNEKIKELRGIILKPDKIAESINLCLYLHSTVHFSDTSGVEFTTLEDELWNDLDEKTFRTASKDHYHTIAYHIWHITRIEDITMNMLAMGEEQVIDSGGWREKLNTSVFDTGNAMTVEEVKKFSDEINMQELKKYRMAVGKRTREIIGSLNAGDMKRKVNQEDLSRILCQGAVLDVPESRWLIDFWGRKNVAGLILMPGTRHQVVHLNEAICAKGRKR